MLRDMQIDFDLTAGVAPLRQARLPPAPQRPCDADKLQLVLIAVGSSHRHRCRTPKRALLPSPAYCKSPTVGAPDKQQPGT